MKKRKYRFLDVSALELFARTDECHETILPAVRHAETLTEPVLFSRLGSRPDQIEAMAHGLPHRIVRVGKNTASTSEYRDAVAFDGPVIRHLLHLLRIDQPSLLELLRDFLLVETRYHPSFLSVSSSSMRGEWNSWIGWEDNRAYKLVPRRLLDGRLNIDCLHAGYLVVCRRNFPSGHSVFTARPYLNGSYESIIDTASFSNILARSSAVSVSQPWDDWVASHIKDYFIH